MSGFAWKMLAVQALALAVALTFYQTTCVRDAASFAVQRYVLNPTEGNARVMTEMLAARHAREERALLLRLSAAGLVLGVGVFAFLRGRRESERAWLSWAKSGTRVSQARPNAAEEQQGC